MAAWFAQPVAQLKFGDFNGDVGLAQGVQGVGHQLGAVAHLDAGKGIDVIVRRNAAGCRLFIDVSPDNRDNRRELSL